MKVKVKDDQGNEVEMDQTETVTSDIEEPVEMDKPGSWPKGWLPNKDEREVGQYLLKVVEASICQDAKTSLQLWATQKIVMASWQLKDLQMSLDETRLIFQ